MVSFSETKYGEKFSVASSLVRFNKSCMFSGIFSRFNYCVNVINDGENILCKNCLVVIGKVTENSLQGLFVELFNIRLVEFSPCQMETTTYDLKEGKLVTRFKEKPNHLKRQSESEVEGSAEKHRKLDHVDPVCLMHVNVSPRELIEPLDTIELPSIPDFDLNDTFSDISDFVLNPDIGLEDIIPYLDDDYPTFQTTSSPIDYYNPLLDNNIDNYSDSDVEIIDDIGLEAYTPPGVCL